MIFLENKKNYNTVIITSDSQEELGKTFIRFQEHYESPNPNFKGKVFTLGQYKHWYSQEYGADTYFTDWKGFNFPSHVLKPFREGLFDPLTIYEQRLLRLLKYRHDNFYIVGANDKDTLKHELAHALYYTDQKYREKIDTILRKNTKYLTPLKEFILNKGYNFDVLHDELQAYIIDNDDFCVSSVPKQLIESIHRLYTIHTGIKNET